MTDASPPAQRRVCREGEVKVEIDRPWLPLNALRAFEAVGSHLSFTAGAQALHVTQSAVSRHVISLEEMLGVKLLERRPHQLVLTEAGASLLPMVRKAFDRLEQALKAIQPGGAEGRTLRVHMPPSLFNHLALPLLRDFRRAFPDLTLDLSSSHVTGLPDVELDIAVVYDRPNVDDRITDLLWMVRVTPVCSPDMAREAVESSLEEFVATHELLHVKLEGEPRDLLWTNFLRQCGVTAPADRGLAFDTALSAVGYAMKGGGVALADVDMFADELRAGRLVAPFSEVHEEGYGYYLKIHAEDLADPLVSLFRSWLIARFQARNRSSEAV
jgi:LysR family glycine cleavage system transcriptional activator